ncbi:MAG: polymer-forming cytoskeletal protein [Gammaproteobacteria bacterium]|nr:polymer-forming cytoskeletal protein [Gammaproteobacteria bacterium]
MWGNARKRKATRTRVVTLIGQHTQIMGDIRFSEGLLIEGTVKGNVFAENDGRSMLSLSESGTIEGEVSVPYVWLNGVVVGDVHSSEHVELSSKARVTGNVYYSLIEMAIGAEVNGKLVHTPQPEGAPLALSHVDPLEVPD